MDEKIKLLPCPFCGHPAESRTAREPSQIGCFNSRCSVRPKASSTCQNTAIGKWNNRVRDSAFNLQPSDFPRIPVAGIVYLKEFVSSLCSPCPPW
jgi:hypothetical protein